MKDASSNDPMISVVVPAYNAEKFIAATLDSVLAQTYSRFEIIVVDDGSQDRTAEIVAAYTQCDSRILLLRQTNQGVAAARNLAIEQSTGEFIAPLDADDIWYPQKLEKQLTLMLQSEPAIGLVYSWSAYISETGSLIGKKQASHHAGVVYAQLLAGNFVGNASAPLIRRSCFEQIGTYNIQMKALEAQGCEDWDLYLRIAEHYQFGLVPEFLIGYRVPIGSMSCQYTAMSKSHKLMMKQVQQRNPSLSSLLLRLSTSKYYLYLTDQSLRGGYHRDTIVCLYKALQLDAALLLNHLLYRRILISSLKLLFQPLASFLWSNHRSWLRFKQQIQVNDRVYTLEDLAALVKPAQEKRRGLYYKVWWRRWERLIQSENLNCALPKQLSKTLITK